MRSILIVLSVFILLVFFTTTSFASSSYVLPYPGIMPGNRLYKLNVLLDTLKGYYSFGDFAQFKYNLFESDKYLVEVKTLFEYNQYPLALEALKKSDTYFKKVLPNLVQAKIDGKDVSDNMYLLSLAREKHIEVLKKIKQETPKTFLWIDEKKAPIQLDIWSKIDQSMNFSSF